MTQKSHKILISKTSALPCSFYLNIQLYLLHATFEIVWYFTQKKKFKKKKNSIQHIRYTNSGSKIRNMWLGSLFCQQDQSVSVYLSCISWHSTVLDAVVCLYWLHRFRSDLSSITSQLFKHNCRNFKLKFSTSADTENSKQSLERATPNSRFWKMPQLCNVL